MTRITNAVKTLIELFDTGGLLRQEEPRVRVHTATDSFEGELWRETVKCELFLTISTDDGEEVSIPVSSVEYAEDLRRDDRQTP